MLTEKTFLNFEKAVFLTENAYFENQINLNQERKNMKNIFKSKGYINNDFSSADKWYSYNHEIDGYVATPDGSLKKYNVETTKTTTVSTYMPSDPNDPGRKNENNPIDIPMEKEREQTKIEPDKKPNLNFLSGRKLR
jgi:hypothetical protein